MTLDPLHSHNLKMALPVFLIRTPIMLVLLVFYKLGQAAERAHDVLNDVLPTFVERAEWETRK
jgi:hypothetical protein